MGFIKDFKKRGYLYQCTDIEEIERLTKTQKLVAYIGFDCTASSLHVGSLMQIMILRLLQQHGHKPIVILGGATSKIGDPTGKDEARRVLTKEELESNSQGIKKSLSKFIKFGDKPSDAILLNNADWLESLNYLEFLRDFGSVVSVNRMLTIDAAKTRLDREQHLSFLEFNYMLLQAYDFYHLNKEYNCSLQLGGSDQWGNIIMGVDLVRKLNDSVAFGLTTPLLTTASGAKMGKSVGGAVWLNEDMLSSYDYYQYWRNCDDRDVVRFAELYCEFTDEQMNEFKIITEADINDAKKKLAFRLTELCHGLQEAHRSMESAVKLFEHGQTDDNLPTFFIETDRWKQGIMAFELFFESGMSDSKSEARRLIRGLGAKINDQIVTDENQIINLCDVSDNRIIKLSSGKKKHILVKSK